MVVLYMESLQSIAKTVLVIILLVINTYNCIFFRGLIPVTHQNTTFVLATMFLSGKTVALMLSAPAAAGNG